MPHSAQIAMNALKRKHEQLLAEHAPLAATHKKRRLEMKERHVREREELAASTPARVPGTQLLTFLEELLDAGGDKDVVQALICSAQNPYGAAVYKLLQGGGAAKLLELVPQPLLLPAGTTGTTGTAAAAGTARTGGEGLSALEAEIRARVAGARPVRVKLPRRAQCTGYKGSEREWHEVNDDDWDEAEVLEADGDHEDEKIGVEYEFMDDSHWDDEQIDEQADSFDHHYNTVRGHSILAAVCFELRPRGASEDAKTGQQQSNNNDN